MSDPLISIAKKSFKEEVEAMLSYSFLARKYRGTSIGEKFSRIAEMERRHVLFWSRFLSKRDINPSNVKPRMFRVKLYILLFHILGLGLTIKLLESSELKAIETYTKLLNNPELSGEEVNELRKILADELVHEEEFVSEETRLEEFIEHIRDAILGMSDGVVEILSVSAGLAGAYGDPLNVAIGGLIVGIAGSLSMGIGAYSSVRAQRQARLSILSRIGLAVKYVPEIFINKVKNYMVRKGFSEETASIIARESILKKEVLERIVAEEEYSVREETIEDPGKAGLYTGLSYIIGAVIPLIPYFLFLPINIAIPLSFVFAALMMGLTGFIIAVSANLDIKKKMIELIITGLGAAMITFAIGKIASMLLGIEIE